MPPKKGHTKKKWTEEDKELLRNLYLFLTDNELAALMGRNPTTIRNVRFKMGLFKTEEQIKKATKKIPIIIVKPKSQYDEDVLQIKNLIGEDE